jgi:hypothetical protein
LSLLVTHACFVTFHLQGLLVKRVLETQEAQESAREAAAEAGDVAMTDDEGAGLRQEDLMKWYLGMQQEK